MDRKDICKKILCYAGIVLLFLTISYAYCYPVLEGRIVNQSDISGWTGMTHEITEHNKANPDDPTLWTNSMFGGMPSVAMYDRFEGDYTNGLYRFLLLGRRPATYIFISLVGAFLLMLSLGTRKIVAVAAAFAMAFCSYNMQIIQVGHNTKMQAIAFFPWVLAALIFTYKSAFRHKDEKWKKWLPQTVLGSVLFAFALSFQIKANHPQITWYLAVVIIIYAIALFINLCINKACKNKFIRFFSASVLLLFIGICGIASNANKLLPTYNYAKYTMRGGSELKKADGSEADSGLELNYATAWSYGIEETPNLIIPNFNGGASASALDRDSECGKMLKKYGYKGRQLDNTLAYMPTYWGPQPFTAGPMYIGAISFFLFILACMVCEGKDKWWIIASSVFMLFLGWGSHMMWFTKICYNILPMYDKFRTVSMALTVLQYTVPMMGFLALDRIYRQNEADKNLKKKTLCAAAISAGICLLLCAIQRVAGSFASAGDPDAFAEALRADRMALLSSDCFRSVLFIILAAFSILFFGFRDESKKKIAAALTGALVLLDMVSVDLRYLNPSHFIEKKEFKSQFDARNADNIILSDKNPDFRVLDLSVNTFNDSHPSYWHKTIGGYSPAKLQRYQDLIDRYITGEINSIIKCVNAEGSIEGTERNFPSTPVLNMLNTKYIIVDGDYPPVQNNNTYGNCWFVNEIAEAGDANEEIAMLKTHNPAETAIIRTEDLNRLKAENVNFEQYKSEEGDSIELISYKANELRYRYNTGSERIAVFSEIYHPGWKASIDGKDTKLFRSNWVLRTAVVPAGNGEIVMRYDPDDYKLGASVSTASSISLYVLLAIAVLLMIFYRKSE